MPRLPVLTRAVPALLLFGAPAAADCPHAVALADTSAPTAIVGTGTPESCTAAVLAAAVAAGGGVTFDCGPAPVTIPIPSTLQIAADTVGDGGHRVTLDGGGNTRLFAVPSVFTFGTPTLTVQRIALTGGPGAAFRAKVTWRIEPVPSPSPAERPVARVTRVTPSGRARRSVPPPAAVAARGRRARPR